MEAPNKSAIVSVVLVCAVCFAAGRWSAPQKIVTETKSTTQQDSQKQVDTDKDQHVQTVVTQVKRPDGTVITRTKRVKDTEVKQQVNENTNTLTQSDTKTEITKGTSPVTINALVGVDVTSLQAGLIYGASISRPILGPITVGIWGMSNKTGGFSLGLQF